MKHSIKDCSNDVLEAWGDYIGDKKLTGSKFSFVFRLSKICNKQESNRNFRIQEHDYHL